MILQVQRSFQLESPFEINVSNPNRQNGGKVRGGARKRCRRILRREKGRKKVANLVSNAWLLLIHFFQVGQYQCCGYLDNHMLRLGLLCIRIIGRNIPSSNKNVKKVLFKKSINNKENVYVDWIYGQNAYL